MQQVVPNPDRNPGKPEITNSSTAERGAEQPSSHAPIPTPVPPPDTAPLAPSVSALPSASQEALVPDAVPIPTAVHAAAPDFPRVDEALNISAFPGPESAPSTALSIELSRANRRKI